jgi:hypothetical protein
MKKKLLLIFFIVLIVIFLILFFLKKDRNINEEINNTINNVNEYKKTLTLKNIYYLENKKMNSKIIYTEIKKGDKYQYINKIYENDTLIKETKDRSFNIDINSFFRKIKSISCSKKYCKTKMKSSDAFSLIYKNSKNKNLDEYLDVKIYTEDKYVSRIEFDTKDKLGNYYFVKLDLDYGLQNIK